MRLDEDKLNALVPVQSEPNLEVISREAAQQSVQFNDIVLHDSQGEVISTGRILREFASIGLADLNAPDNPYKAADKLKALESMAKMLGMYELDNRQKADNGVKIDIKWLE